MKDDLTILMDTICWILRHLFVLLLGLVSLIAAGLILYIGIKLA